MDVLATVGRPIVTLLSVSTDTILRSFGARHVKQPAVTLEEIRVLLEQGADEGVFEGAEHEMVTNVLNLDDRHVGAVLTPRSDVVFLDVRDPLDANRQKLRQDLHPVCCSPLRFRPERASTPRSSRPRLETCWTISIVPRPAIFSS